MKLDPEIVAEGWVDLQSLSGKSTEHYIGFWAEDVLRCAIECDENYAWQIIQAISERLIEQKHVGKFAAGPLEDFLCQHGAAMLNEVLKKAREDSKFNHALGGVWQSSIPEDVWKKLQEVRQAVW